MFTGIIEETGTVKNIRKNPTSSFIVIETKNILSDTAVGDSIAVNGVCLTVTGLDKNLFEADVMNETLRRSSLGELKQGSRVNLERAMAANGRFGGHIVSGHIDGTGIIKHIENDGIAVWYRVSADEMILRYIVEKGSVALDGISLTVAKTDSSSFSVSVIPHTAANTTLSSKKVGDIINIENDIIGKYVEKLLNTDNNKPKGRGGLSAKLLMENGFI